MTERTAKMGDNGHPLVARVMADPIMLAEGHEEFFATSLTKLLQEDDKGLLSGTGETPEAQAAADHDFWGFEPGSFLSYLRPYSVREGILQIKVTGTLMNRFPYQWGNWATGYTYIEKALARGLEDPEVNGIAFIVDSPGGVVSGNFELVDKIFAARGQKPMKAFAADYAMSAAYSIASAADELIVTRSGKVGSIGVRMLHMDFSERLKMLGVKPTYIFEGAHKIDGNPNQALSDQAKDRFKKSVKKSYAVFTETVARNRGIPESDVRATEAMVYDSEDGIAAGLADRVGSLDEEIATFADETTEADNGDHHMAKTTTTEDATFTQADLDAAAAKAVEEARDDILKEGATAERTRIKGILASDGAKDRQKAAMHTAMNTDMSVEDASSFLEGFDTEAAATPATTPATAAAATTTAGNAHFDKAMADTEVEVEAGNDTPKSELSDGQQLLADAALAG